MNNESNGLQSTELPGVFADLFPTEAYRPSVVEMFSAAWCNLDCRYCYIPKDQDMMTGIHRKIIKSLKDGSFLKYYERTMGKSLKHLTHWGTEPTITLPHFTEFYKQAVKVFPKLDSIFLSTNFMIGGRMADFIINLPRERKFFVEVQMSLDGPPWITDRNRRLGCKTCSGSGSATKTIVENIIDFVERINAADFPHVVKAHFKPTMSMGDIETLSDYDTLKEFYEFFDQVFERIFKANSKNRIKFGLNCDPTYQAPGRYRAVDGQHFYNLYRSQMLLRQNHRFRHINPDCDYYYRFMRVTRFASEFYTKQRMFTCCAGDSSISLDEEFHVQPCHRTFYLNYPGYLDIMRRDKTRDHDEMTHVDAGRFDVLKNTLIASSDDPDGVARVFRVYRGFHDFVKLRLQGIVACCIEMSKAGLLSPCYQDPEVSKWLAIYCSVMNCPTENVVWHGTMNATIVSMLKLYGNGVFEHFMRRARQELMYTRSSRGSAEL